MAKSKDGYVAMVTLDEYRHRCQCGDAAFVSVRGRLMCKECYARRNDKLWRKRYGHDRDR